MKKANVKAPATTAQLLTQFGLDWTVEKKPFHFHSKDGKGNVVERPSDYFGLVRSDDDAVLGHCKDSYHAFQNELIMNTMKKFGDDYGLVMEQAGAFGGGKKVFFQLYVPNDVKIGKNKDSIQQYIFAINSFDHSTRLNFGYTNRVISCANQFNRLTRQDTTVRIKHTESGEAKIIELPNLFAEQLELRKLTNEIFLNWDSTPATKAMAKELIARITGTDVALTAAKRAEMGTRSLNILEGLEGAIAREMKEKGDTMWGLFNGITYYANYIKSFPKRDNGQLESILMGTGAQMMNKGFNIIQELAG